MALVVPGKHLRTSSRLNKSTQEPSKQASCIAGKLRSGTIGPVLSFRTDLNNCRAVDVRCVLEALVDCESVHMLSVGRNDALECSPDLVVLLVRVLRCGYIWACDFGELRLRDDVLSLLVSGLQDTTANSESSWKPSTNLAYIFADVGCGLSSDRVLALKELTRARRTIDKSVPPPLVGRLRAPWLQIDNVFGWIMRSENLTRCFWRPYQEPVFWRRAGFRCPVAKKT